MTDVLAHRGPDDEGLFAEGPVVLGHRRLSILDLSSAGHQPMAVDEGRLWLTYNGEVYNYVELAEELRELGHSFASSCDTEVLVHAYAEWGADCLARLNGMFSFAIWDGERGSLFCARDRFGIKPFYYTVAAGRFRFASEIKALLLDPSVAREPNEPRVRDFLARGLADHTGETMFAGILQLRPGHHMEVTPAGVGGQHRWYEPQLAGRPTPADVRAAVARSVGLRLRSDVPVGTCLSGGVDSSTVVALSAEQRRARGAEPPASFSARCDDPALDEGAYIGAVVERVASRHHEVTPNDDDLLASIDTILWHMDEPFHGPSVFGHWKVMQLARESGVTVLLDGQGGDEVFAGYHHLYPAFVLDLARRGRLRRLWQELRARQRLQGYAIARSLLDAAKLLAPARLRGRDVPPWLADPPRALRARRRLAAARRFDLEVSPLPAYLHHVDRNSMSFSLEARVPLLDYHVVETGLAAGGDDLVRNGRTKWILREAMRPLLPGEIVDRSDKQGFTVDHRAWLRGPLGRVLDETFASERMAARPFFHAERLSDALEDGSADAVWRSFMVERWLRLFVDPAVVEPVGERRLADVAGI